MHAEITNINRQGMARTKLLQVTHQDKKSQAAQPGTCPCNSSGVTGSHYQHCCGQCTSCRHATAVLLCAGKAAQPCTHSSGYLQLLITPLATCKGHSCQKAAASCHDTHASLKLIASIYKASCILHSSAAVSAATKLYYMQCTCSHDKFCFLS